jgi:hypothetical protein
MTYAWNITGREISLQLVFGIVDVDLRGVDEMSSSCKSNAHSTCSGDSLMGVMGLDERRCFSLLRLRCVLGFLGA